jgi:hypothetical protein
VGRKKKKLTPSKTLEFGGYAMLQRNGCIEIWDYYIDVLVEMKATWREAFEWSDQNRTIPPLPERPWPSGYPDGERPEPYVPRHLSDPRK